MKDRVLKFSIVTLIIGLLVFAFLFTRNRSEKNVMSFNNDDMAYLVPEYSPINNSDLEINLIMNLNEFPKLIRSRAPKKYKKDAEEISTKLRNGIFALANLDFEKEIQSWVGEKIMIAIFNPKTSQEKADWIIGLSINNLDQAKLFIENFWENMEPTEKRAGNTLNTSSQVNHNQIATILIPNKVILISSSRNILIDSLKGKKVSNIEQVKESQSENIYKNLGKGFAFFEASPSTLENTFQFPHEMFSDNEVKKLIGKIAFKESKLILNGYLKLNEMVNPTIAEPTNQKYKFESLGGDVQSIAQFSNPAKLLKKDNQSLLEKTLGIIISSQLNKIDNPIAQKVATSDEGELLWLNFPEGWVLGTTAEEPTINSINNILEQDNFIQSILSMDNKKIITWSKLIIENSLLKNEVPILVEHEVDTTWWGSNLESIKEREKKQSENIIPLLKEFDALTNMNGDNLEQRIVFNQSDSQVQLEKWQPWHLLEILTGDSFSSIVNQLGIGFGRDFTLKEPSIYLNGQIVFKEKN